MGTDHPSLPVQWAEDAWGQHMLFCANGERAPYGCWQQEPPPPPKTSLTPAPSCRGSLGRRGWLKKEAHSFEAHSALFLEPVTHPQDQHWKPGREEACSLGPKQG